MKLFLNTYSILQAIKYSIENLKPRVDNIETDRIIAIKTASPAQMDQVRRVIDKLREEWAQVSFMLSI